MVLCDCDAEYEQRNVGIYGIGHRRTFKGEDME